MVFTGCDDEDEDEEPIPPASTTTENFDLVKNMLSEIFDKPEEENLVPPAAEPAVDLTEDEIHQLTPAEIDRVDSLLRDIVSAQQAEATAVETAAEISLPIDEELTRVEQEWAQFTEDEKQLGSIAPQWIGDDQTNVCMKCSAKFSITRRRHHCRACGKIFCSSCSSQKVKLVHDDSREDRACDDCVRIINRGASSHSSIKRTNERLVSYSSRIPSKLHAT